MRILSPVVSIFVATLVAVAYFGVVRSETLNNDVHLIFLLVMGTLVGSAAFRFSARELKETEGLQNMLDLGFLKLIGSLLFGVFIAIGFDGLILVFAEITASLELPDPVNFFDANSGLTISITIIRLLVAFLVIYPFFQFYYLAAPGEASSIPAEYPLEALMESFRELTKSPFIAAVFVYSISYILPIVLLTQVVGEFQLAILLWAIIFPLISIGALSGAGIGEDLIRLRLLRRPIRDLGKLGMPKINLAEGRFDIGGFFLVLFAIQAIFTTAVFGILGIVRVFQIPTEVSSSEEDPFLLSIFANMDPRTAVLIAAFSTLGLALFNKGRGAYKELNEVWNEAGFKVNVFQLFLPVYVFLGVVLSSALEVFVSQASRNPNYRGVLAELGLDDQGLLILTSFILFVSNFVLIFTAMYVFRRTPGTAERRMIKDVPEFYGNDIDGYLYIYSKIKDDQSVENLLKELTNMLHKDQSQIELLKGVIKETLGSPATNVQIASAETLYTMIEGMDEFDPELYELNKLALESEAVGARIYGIKAMKNILRLLEGQEKEEAIKYFQSYIGDDDPVVSWDTGIVLQRILKEEPKYRSFILALMIKTLNETEKQSSIDAITRFFNRLAKENTEIGQMALSTLAIQLTSGENKHPENLILGIKSLLRGNSFLVEDLIDQIAVTMHHSDFDFRKNSYLVLADMAQYGAGREEEVLELIISGINDESEEIQVIAYDALTKELGHAPHFAQQIFAILLSKFTTLRGPPLLGALDVINTLINLDLDLEQEVFDLIKGASDSSTPEVRSKVQKILGNIAIKKQNLCESIYYISEKNSKHEVATVRRDAVLTLGKTVAGNPNLARTVYRELSTARDDESLIVQLAAIESLGYVATATSEFATEIVETLTPMLDDEDWQVRLSSLNGLFAAVQQRRDLRDELVSLATKALKDVDGNIRDRSLDIINWLLINHRPSSRIILQDITQNIKRYDTATQDSMISAMELIAAQSLLSVPQILKNIQIAYENPNNNIRFSANETLKSSLEKLQSTREVSSDAHSAMNNLITRLMKAANNSDPAIRRSSYEAITEICAALPTIKVADRGRNAINKAIRLEKDVGLQEYLEEARIRARKPLDFS